MALWYPALSGIALAFFSAALAPILHWLPLPPQVDIAIAAALDALEPRLPTVFTADTLLSTDWTVFHPGGYHGPGTWTTSGSANAGFFEGWYYKMVSSQHQTLIVIPGEIHGKGLQDGSGGFSFVMVANPAH